MNLKNKKAFTLIELLVVIAIIAILAALAIPQVMGLIQRAQNAAIIADTRALYSFAVKNQIDTGNYDAMRCVGGHRDVAAICASLTRAAGAAPISHSASIAGPTTYFCIQTPLRGGGYRCADHLGHWHIPVGASVCAAPGPSLVRATRTVNTDLTLTADLAGTIGNNISIELVPDATLGVLTVTLTGNAIRVSGDTNTIAGIQATTIDVATAINAHTGAAALVDATGGITTMTTVAAISLSGGAGNTPRCR